MHPPRGRECFKCFKCFKCFGIVIATDPIPQFFVLLLLRGSLSTFSRSQKPPIPPQSSGGQTSRPYIYKLDRLCR